jgi:putative phage-type endonuclease
VLTPEQIELRRTGIGGSEIAALVGEDAFSSPFDVWLSKTQGWVKPSNPDMERGSFLEAGIADWYAHRTGSTLVEMGAFVHPTNTILRCTPDRFEVVDDETLRLVSIKSPRRGDAWGKAGTDDVPPSYLLQLQWEHAVVSGCGSGLHPALCLADDMRLVALVDGELRVYEIKADLEIQAWLLDYAQQWWTRHVVGGEQPSLEGSSEANRWLRSRFPRDTAPIRQATMAEDLGMLELRAVEADLARLESEAETLKLALMQAIGDAGGLESPAGRITYRADKNGKRSFKTRWAEE